MTQLVDRGRINMEDVASQIGISANSLSASLAVMTKMIAFYVPN